MNLQELLQLYLLGRRTGKLHILMPDGTPHGLILMGDGRILHAATGELTGETAFYVLLSSDVPFSARFDEAPPGNDHTIDADPHLLLMEAARRKDMERSATLATAAATPPTGTGCHDNSLVVLTDITHRVIPLGPDKFTIGRHANCSLQLANSTVSQHHASIEFKDGRHCVQDEGSTNGTFLNSEPVWESTHLVADDLIRVGSVLIRYQAAHTHYGRRRLSDGSFSQRFTLPPMANPSSDNPNAQTPVPTLHAG